MANQHNWNPGGWRPPGDSGSGGYPAVPTQSGTHRVAGEAYASTQALWTPASILDSFGARYTDIYGARGIEVYVSLIRDGRLAQIVHAPEVRTALACGEMHVGVRADRPGRWCAYFPDDHTYADLPDGDTGFLDLGRLETSGVLWFFPPVPSTLILWLYVYANSQWLPFDPNASFPHRIDANGALRCIVTN